MLFPPQPQVSNSPTNFGRRASYTVLKLMGIKGYKHNKTTVNPSLQHASTNDRNKLEEWSP